MRRLTGFLVTAMATTLLASFNANADPSMECDGTSQVEIRACLDETLTRADAAVDEAFSFALASAAETDEVTGRASVVPALYDSQSAWEAFRDSQCDYVGSTYGGGSGTGIAILACRITEARARTTELLGGLD
ncbi:MAG: lysozyme inhibitor LprI family protein [Pseudomonadota bacterium]